MTLKNINAALPVSFGTIQTSFSDNQLSIDWTTHSEKGNQHFEMQASKDGKNFKPLSAIPSKAVDGNSSSTFQYNFSIGVQGTAALFALVGLLFISSSLFRRGQLKFIISSIMLLAAIYGYSKKAASFADHETQKLYIRIGQVQKDGTKSYS